MGLPAGTHIGAVRLQVSDLSRSIEYYETTLGLRVHESSAGAAVLTPRGDATPLLLLHEKSGIAPAPPRGAFGLFHFAVLLPERAALGRFVAHLGRLGVRAGAANHLVSEALYLTDPDGLGIEVYADRPRETWQYAGGEIRMTTDPLDVGDLVAAGGDVRWNGAPAGTTMGHVHLHVGNLDEAERFYGDTLGFDVTMRGYPGARFFAAGGYHHHLGTNTWSPGPAATDGQARLLDWELIVPGAEGRTLVDPWGTTVKISPGLPIDSNPRR
jgi:catechol 2,3-dioxygenase